MYSILSEGARKIYSSVDLILSALGALPTVHQWTGGNLEMIGEEEEGLRPSSELSDCLYQALELRFSASPDRFTTFLNYGVAGWLDRE